jgi:hypothetical protein
VAALFAAARYRSEPVPRHVVAVVMEDTTLAADHWSVDFWIDDVIAACARLTFHCRW